MDAYPFLLGGELNAEDVKQISYWYSMWSHRRNGQWKGFLQIGLSPDADDVARHLLTQIEVEAL